MMTYEKPIAERIAFLAEEPVMLTLGSEGLEFDDYEEEEEVE